MSATAEESERISNLVVSIFRSPTWILPVAKFVDENCCIFENQEENKLEYTTVHNSFKQLVEDLLLVHLIELRISTDEFTNFCQNGLTGNNELHRSLVEQLISVDDFLVFKAMMVKRNTELSREVLQLHNPIIAGIVIAEPEEDPHSDDALEQARLERLEAEQRCVEAELQLAIALSRHLERRLQLIEALNEVLQMAAMLNLQAETMALQATEAEHVESAVQLQQEQLGLPAYIRLQPLGDSDTGSTWEDPVTAENRRAEAAWQQQRAEEAVAAVSRASAAAAETIATNPNQPTEEEKQARAEHLKRRREALLEKKNRDREQQLNEFQMVNGSTASSKIASKACAASANLTEPDAGKRLAAELRGEVLEAVKQTELPDPEAAALEMRRALAKQLKQTLTQSMA
jgi:hypothetical protein